MTNYPLRARYGVRDNMHTLLEWDIRHGDLPSELLGLTDKPPGSHAPGECWWPSVGCAPVGHWWALWWTTPDNQASRGGMVISEVALWPLDQIGAVDDLSDILSELSSGAPNTPPTQESLQIVAHFLIEGGSPPVYEGLETWPGIISKLWKRLWPEARKCFSARVAISPPQGGESVAPPWIVATPKERIVQWSSHRIIPQSIDAHEVGRAASWLAGNNDPVLDEIIAHCPLLTYDIGGLRRVARATEHLEQLRFNKDAKFALAFLRTIITIAPTIQSARSLKQEALNTLKIGLKNADALLILALANFKIELFEDSDSLNQLLHDWILKNILALPLSYITRMLSALKKDKAEIWWQTTILNSLSSIIEVGSQESYRSCLNWLTIKDHHSVLFQVVPNNELIESELLQFANYLNFSEPDIKSIQEFSKLRRWSKLHAWALFMLLPARQAFSEQYLFDGNILPGLSYLVWHLEGNTVVREAVSRANPELIMLLAHRTIQEPELLCDLDVDNNAWLALWAAHLSMGGIPWCNSMNKMLIGKKLLNNLKDKQIPKGLIPHIVEDLAAIAIDHEKRCELWGQLSDFDNDLLLSHVANKYLEQLELERDIQREPEGPLLKVILNAIEKQSELKPITLASVLNWNVPLSENNTIRWLKQGDWSIYSQEIGSSIARRKWYGAAEVVYKLNRDQSGVFKPALLLCGHLIIDDDRSVGVFSKIKSNSSFMGLFSLQERKDRWGIFKNNFSDFSLDNYLTRDEGHHQFLNDVAELGASIAPDGLVDLWCRAGGYSEQLIRTGTPASQWLAAVRLADQGALPHNVTSLLHVLKEIVPHNQKIKSMLLQLKK